MSGTTFAGSDLRLRIGRSDVAASDRAAVGAAIEAENARARSAGLPEGLPDDFNPAIIDPAKADALLQALMRPPGDLLAPLGARVLELNPMALRIGTSSPTTIASFAKPFTLAIASEHGDMVSARAVSPVDCDLAHHRAAEARRLTEAADRDYQAASGPAIMSLRQRRYALARVWFDNAAARAECRPEDSAAAADREAAAQTMKAAVVIGGTMQ